MQLYLSLYISSFQEVEEEEEEEEEEKSEKINFTN